MSERRTTQRDARWAREIRSQLAQCAGVLETMARETVGEVLHCADLIAGALRTGGKVLTFGNGGSASEAQHLASELVAAGDLVAPLRATALTADTSVLTALSNDLGYERVFARQVEALALPGDALVAISTSGDSENVLQAVRVGQRMGCVTIAFTGRRGQLARLADAFVGVPATSAARIQEAHVLLVHVITNLVSSMVTGGPPLAGGNNGQRPEDAGRRALGENMRVDDRFDLSRVRTRPVRSRAHKVQAARFARPLKAGASFSSFVGEAVPRIQTGAAFHRVVEAIVEARVRDRSVALAIGGHVIKCGLGPTIVDLMQRGVVTSVAMNGGASIHDFEAALFGETSEEVARGLSDGSFGTVEETGWLMNEAVLAARRAEGPDFRAGMGELLGRSLNALGAPFRAGSILAQGVDLGIPVTVHVAMGAETVHMHPAAQGAAIGQATFNDFRRFATALTELGRGGVYMNIGSAVVLPEVFLKALTMLRNVGEDVFGFVAVNMDMEQRYRPTENVLHRPTAEDGEAYSLCGAHELMVPLLAQAVVEALPYRWEQEGTWG
jgi:phosphoheptose isomerase